jgi:hypothetical protein
MYTYDTAGTVFKVKTTQLWDDSTTHVVPFTDMIVQAFDGIGATLSDLKLGWVGKTAEEADLYKRSWTTVMTTFFGNPDTGEQSVLDRVVQCAGIASLNFAGTEDNLVDMWNKMTAGFSDTSAADTSSSAPPTDVTDYPVTEVFPK